MKTRPEFAWSEVGSVMSAAVRSAWPRGAFTSARRYASTCFTHQSRWCAGDFPCGRGTPSRTRRSGCPPTWASMVLITRIIRGLLLSNLALSPKGNGDDQETKNDSPRNPRCRRRVRSRGGGHRNLDCQVARRERVDG